jgi:Fe-S-cluster containining protein
MPCETVITPETILKDSARLGADDRFTFRCGPDLDCFTKCCRDVTIVLTPYDVLRLKRTAGLDSSEFLERHTLRIQMPGQKFPIVILKMDEESKACPFLCRPLPDGRGSETVTEPRPTGSGCGVYPDRPWACRMYPLGAAEPKAPAGDQTAFHFVIQENLCHGHGEGRSVSVREWMAEQQIEEFEMLSAGFKDLTLHSFWDGNKELTPQQADMFYMACFDLDRFRRFVFETRFLQLFDVDEARVEAIRTDDLDLLDFAMQWLRFSLFGERAMKVRRQG